jgi:hypothetical protein
MVVKCRGEIKMIFNKFKKMLKRSDKRTGKQCCELQTDVAAIKIGDLLVTMARRVNLPVPHEFSVFVPRVEIRQRYYRDNQLQYEKELIFNSLTIVHAPQHPPAEGDKNSRKTSWVTGNQKMD